MTAAVADAVSSALAVPPEGAGELPFDRAALVAELEEVAQEAAVAIGEGLSLADAVADPRFSALGQFHRDLRDSLFVELPKDLRAMVEATSNPTGEARPAADAFARSLADLARPGEPGEPGAEALDAGDLAPDDLDAQDEAPISDGERSRALAELLVFEAVRLRLLVQAWSSEDFERLGGCEEDVDFIAASEVETILGDVELTEGDVRPLVLMVAAGSMRLARTTAERAEALRTIGPDVREDLAMQARLRSALRDLRLPESVLLENALANLLGEDREELPALQAAHRVALSGLSRQAMDQRVSRGRKALTRSRDQWPTRRGPALIDLLNDG